MAAVVARQHGVISHAQLRDAGLSSSTISRWAAAERLTRLRRGVFAVGHRSLTRDGWWNAAVLVAGPGSTLTGGAACAIWNVLAVDHGPIDVHPHGHVKNPPPWLRVNRTGLVLGASTVRRGLPVAALSQAIVDLAEHAPQHDVASALDRALLLGLLDRRALDEAVARAHGRHGLKVLLPAMSRLSAQGETFLSKTERRVRDALLDAGLPRPLANVRIYGPGGRRCRPDLRWADAWLIVEIDGPQHRMPFQRALDMQRDTWLRALGYRVLRFPVEQADDDLPWVVASIARALTARGDVIHLVPAPRAQGG